VNFNEETAGPVLDALGLGNVRELYEYLATCHADTAFFAKAFFPEVFHRPWSKLHLGLCNILDDDSLQKVAIAAPRGFGKTSLFNLAFPAKRILFQDSRHIIPVSATADAAVEQADDLKDELVTNPLIRTLFGDLKAQERKDPFGQKEWVTSNGVKVRPRGAQQQIRGRKYRSQRPDLFIVDDLEDDEAVESSDQRKKLAKWFFSALVNSVDRGSHNWRIIVIGTILHEDSLLNNLLQDPSWYSVRFELCDDAYKSNWPEYMSDEQVAALANEYRQSGLLRLFYMEHRNIPIALEDQGFKEEYFQPYKESPDFWAEYRPAELETVVLSDPAKTMEEGSCNTALAVITVNRRTEELYIRDIVSDKFDPHSHINEMFDLAERYNAMVLAPEVTGLNEYLMWPIRNEMIRRKSHYHIVEVKPREAKRGPRRSGGLIPLYRNKKIYHNEAVCGKLEKCLMQWPRPESWDEIDAVSSIIFALEDGKRFLGPIDDAETPEDIEKEYEEIEYDEDELEPLLGTFI